MALGTMVSIAAHMKGPLFVDEVTLVGESSYAAAGSTGLKAALQALRDDQRVPVAIVQTDDSGYILRYTQADDALKVLYSNSDAADGPLIAVPNATVLSGVTFRMIIFSK